MRKNTLFSLIALFILGLSSCKKDEVSAAKKQVVNFHWHSMVGTDDAAFGITYTSNGVRFKLTDWRYYASNFVLIKEDGTEYPIDGKVFLINIANSDYSLDSVPTGNYKGFKFVVGLDSATNHKDPTTYDASNPLSIQSPSIHWSWNSGYIFIKIEGKYDSTLAQTGAIDQPFFYHVGTDNLKRTVDMSDHAFTVSADGATTLHLEMDMLSILQNINLKTENATHTMDNMPVAMKVANNIPGSFE